MPARRQRTISWDGLSFAVPANWELALYKRVKRKIWHLEIEDEYSVRLDIEWIAPKSPLDIPTVLGRYEKGASQLTRKAASSKAVDNMPEGWNATHHLLRDTEGRKGQKGLQSTEHGLTTAFHVSPDKRLFCFVLLHTYPESPEGPVGTIRDFAKGFVRHDGPLIPWQLYDLSFELPRDFLLEYTQFDIGAKLMVFRWRWRKLYLWHFSCADRFLDQGQSKEEWATAFLNSFRHIRGLRFDPGRNGEILWRRRRRHLFGHRDEIVRGCRRWQARCRRDEENNQLMLWVFNYRKDSDLEKLPPYLGASRAL
jgi:hypothetical protein